MDATSEAPLEIKCIILDSLPNELLHKIYSHCATNTKLSMKMCCKKLLDCTPGTVRELYKDLSLTTPMFRRELELLRFERLCLDDNYTCTRDNKAACSACLWLHKIEQFSADEVGKNPRERVCEASQRILHLTPSTARWPGTSFTGQQLLRSCLEPHSELPYPYEPDSDMEIKIHRVRVEHRCPYRYVEMERSDGEHFVQMTWGFPLQLWDDDWLDKLRCGLEAFPFCICPHLKSSEPQVLQAVTSYCQASGPNFVKCPTCKLAILEVHFEFDRFQGLGFQGFRLIGNLTEPGVDTEWKAQSSPLATKSALGEDTET